MKLYNKKSLLISYLRCKSRSIAFICLHIQRFVVELPFEEYAFNEVPCGATCAVTFPDVVPVSLVPGVVLLFNAFNEVPCGATCAVTFPDVVPVCAYANPQALVQTIPNININVIVIGKISFILQIIILKI
jgi:hypothetical protein